MDTTTEKLVQIGMRAAIRDIQDYITVNNFSENHLAVLNLDDLNAYLLAMLITTGLYEDIPDSADTAA